MNKQLIRPDGDNTVLLSNLMEQFGGICEEMREHLNSLQEEDATVILIDDFYPFKYASMDDFLDSFDSLLKEQENYWKELSEEQ